VTATATHLRCRCDKSKRATAAAVAASNVPCKMDKKKAAPKDWRLTLWHFNNSSSSEASEGTVDPDDDDWCPIAQHQKFLRQREKNKRNRQCWLDQEKEFEEVLFGTNNKRKRLAKSKGKTAATKKKKKSNSPKKPPAQHVRSRHQWLLDSDTEDEKEKENAHEHSDWGVAKKIVVTQESTAPAAARRDPKRPRDILASKQNDLSPLDCSCIGDQSSSSDSERDDNNRSVPSTVAVKRNGASSNRETETDAEDSDGDAGGNGETSESESDCASGNTVVIMDPEGHCSAFRNINSIVASKVNAAALLLQEAKLAQSVELLQGIMQKCGDKLTTKGKHEIKETILRN